MGVKALKESGIKSLHIRITNAWTLNHYDSSTRYTYFGVYYQGYCVGDKSTSSTNWLSSHTAIYSTMGKDTALTMSFLVGTVVEEDKQFILMWC